MQLADDKRTNAPPTDRSAVPIEREFYLQPTVSVARNLLGNAVIRWFADGAIAGGFIVETEAYLQDDPACHAFGGQTERNRSLFGPPGHAYVYRSYGIHMMLNVVCGAAGQGEGVLIRALEPFCGVEVMRRNRHISRAIDLSNGPGKLGQAIGLSVLEHDSVDVTDPTSNLQIVRAVMPPLEIAASSRIGITRALEFQWRFYIRGNDFISRKSS